MGSAQYPPSLIIMRGYSDGWIDGKCAVLWSTVLLGLGLGLAPISSIKLELHEAHVPRANIM